MKRGPGRLLPVVLLAGACSSPPDPSAVEALASGLWHAEVGEDDYVYEFTAGVSLGGKVYRTSRGRHINEIPLSRVILRGTKIEIGHGRFPSYHGVVDLEEGRIEGGIPAEPPFAEMDLTRVDRAAWPMLRLRADPGPAPATAVWSRPEERAGGWPVAAPSEVGLDPASIEATLRAILEGEAAALHSFLLVRDGRLVVEEYFHGWLRDDLHEILSCTKSVASLLVGIAIDRGHLPGVEVPLLDFFPEHRERAAAGWESVRLEHFLTMTTGLDWSRRPAPGGRERIADAFGREVGHPPGTRFVYGSEGFDLLAEILLDTTGVAADSFAATHLFTPLGIDDWDWTERRWPDHPELSAGLKMRPRDMARLGQLVLEEGVWQGRKVVSSEWIRRSTRTHVPQTPHGVQYGYLWWRIDPPSSGEAHGSVTFANGVGSQFIVVIPDARLVLVTTGGNPHNGRQFDIARVVERHLLRGVFLGPKSAR